MSGLSETVFSSPHAAALQALKRKKRYEKQLAQIDGTLSTIEFQREALENANTNTEVLKNMGYAAKAMKAAHDNMYVAPAGGGGHTRKGGAGRASLSPRPLDSSIQAPKFVLIFIFSGTPLKWIMVPCCPQKQISWNETVF